VRLEALQAAVDGEAQEGRVGAHRQLGLAAASLLRILIIDVVSDFRRVDDVAAPPAEGLGELALGEAVAVGVGGVEEGDAVVVVCAAEHRHSLGVRLLAPPAGGDGPGAEADLAHGDRRAGEDAVLHACPKLGRAVSSAAASRAKYVMMTSAPARRMPSSDSIITRSRSIQPRSAAACIIANSPLT